MPNWLHDMKFRFHNATRNGACAERKPAGPALSELTPLDLPAGAPAGEPNLAIGSDGEVYLSWIELQPDSTHALRIATLGQTGFDAPYTIAAGRDWFVNWADFPMVSSNNGVLAAHWLQRGGHGKYNYGVRVSLSSDGGKTWSAPVTPHRDTTPSEHGFVSLFPLADGFGAVWLDARHHAAAHNGAPEGAMGLRFTTISRTGVLGADTAVDDRTCDCCQTSVATTSKGPLVVYRDRSADEVRDIYVARYQQGRWSDARAVHNDGWKIDFCPVNGPAVAARDDRVVVAWFTAADSLPRVLVAFSNDAGQSFGQPIRVDRGNPAGRVDVQLLANGDAIVTWLENVPEASLRVRQVRESGDLSPDRVITPLTAERPSGFPHLIVQGDQVVFAWTEPGSPARIRAARAQLSQ
jgi:hypothetical protein